MPMVVALAVTATLALTVIFVPKLWRWATEEEPVAPDVIEGATAASLDGIDLRRVHAELLPAWVVARGNPAQEKAAFVELRTALAPNPTLASIVAKLREHTEPAALRRPDDQEQFIASIERWNDFLDEEGISYMVRGNITGNEEEASFYLLSYEVVERGTARVADVDQRVRFLRRVDQLNIRERYLGLVRDEQEGAVIFVDNAIAFALDQVWPLLAAVDDDAPLDATWAAFAPAVTAEVRADLEAAHFEVLRETAAARQAIASAVATIGERQACGSRFSVRHTPWNGYNEEELAAFRVAQRRSDGDCPEVTQEELRRIEEASELLHRAAGLRPAAEALTAWAARPLVVHEARHAADHMHRATPFARICSWCGPNDPEPARAELSAYLAELAWTQSPAVALYQACRATEHDAGSEHGEALDAIITHADHPCSEGPLPNATEVARRLEREAFGRADPIAWQGEHPARLPVNNLRVGR